MPACSSITTLPCSKQALERFCARLLEADKVEADFLDKKTAFGPKPLFDVSNNCCV